MQTLDVLLPNLARTRLSKDHDCREQSLLKTPQGVRSAGCSRQNRILAQPPASVAEVAMQIIAKDQHVF
jgi:hypothetical protein